MRTTTPSWLLLVAFAAAATGCKGNGKTTTQEGGAKDGSDGDTTTDGAAEGDDDVEVLIPLGLLDPAQIATTTEPQGPAAVDEDPTVEDCNADAIDGVTSEPIGEVESGMRGMNRWSYMHARCMTKGLALIYQKLRDTLPDGEIKAAANEPARFRLTPEAAANQDDPEFVELLPLPATSGFDYEAAFFVRSPNPEAGYERTASVKVKGDDQGKALRAEATRFLRLESVLVSTQLTTDFAANTLSSSSRYLFTEGDRLLGGRLELDRNAGNFALSTGIAYLSVPQVATRLGPRYYNVVSGDVVLGQFRYRPGQPEFAQRLAFLPVEDVAAVGLNGPPSVAFSRATFVDRALDELMSTFVVGVVRDQDRFAGCTTFGQEVRAVWGESPPGKIKQLPDDVCATNPSLVDADLAHALTAACLKKISPLSAPLTSGDTLEVCEHVFPATFSANPQYGNVKQKGLEFDAAGHTPNQAQTTLGSAWPDALFIDLSAFSDQTTRPEPVLKSADAFQGL